MADKSLRRGRERQTVGTKALHRGRKRQTVGTKALRRLRERCGSNFILGGGIEVAWPGLLRCEVEREGVAPKSLRQGRERSSVFDSLGACFSSLNTREKRRSSKSSSPRTREKRIGLKICTREVEREAAIAQLCIYEMKQMAVWPDLAWGSREREAVCALDFQTKTTDKQGLRFRILKIYSDIKHVPKRPGAPGSFDSALHNGKNSHLKIGEISCQETIFSTTPSSIQECSFVASAGCSQTL